MSKYLSQNNRVSICHKDNCIHATGENADMIAKAAAVMLLFIGIGALVRAFSK